MATYKLIKKKYRAVQKTGDNEFTQMQLETVAEQVKVDAIDGLDSTNTDLKEVLTEVSEKIEEIVSGNKVVTGILSSDGRTYKKGAVELEPGDVKLGNVNNTADTDKPVSTAQAAAIAAAQAAAEASANAYTDSEITSFKQEVATAVSEAIDDAVAESNDYTDSEITGLENRVDTKLKDYVPVNQKGTANGVAPLDGSGKVAAQYLPSYVDDVLEYSTLTSFPTPGEAGKIYVALDTNKTYRWGGTEYVVISDTIALGETTGAAYDGAKGKANADAITALQARAAAIETKNTQQDSAISDLQSAVEDLNGDVEALQASVSNAQADATKGINDAASAKSAADKAQADATEALADAATADGKAVAAAAAAAAAQADATQALTNAATANSAAQNAQSAAEQAASDAATAKSTAEAAQAAATANSSEITNIKNGTTKVGKATVADTATKLASSVKLVLSEDGDVTGESAEWDGSSDITLDAVLQSIATPGTYQQVIIDEKGRVISGQKIIAIGTAENNTPPSDLAIGGIFFEEIED